MKLKIKRARMKLLGFFHNLVGNIKQNSLLKNNLFQRSTQKIQMTVYFFKNGYKNLLCKPSDLNS